MSDLNALVGIDFSLIGTKLRAVYEKRGDNGYAILLTPTPQDADNGVTLKVLMEDVKKLIYGKSCSDEDAKKLEDSFGKQLGSLSEDTGSDWKNIEIKLDVAYLYIDRGGSENITEYAFQMEIITEAAIPQEIKDMVTVNNLSVAVWNTSRKSVVEKMNLRTISSYIAELDSQAIEEKQEEGTE